MLKKPQSELDSALEMGLRDIDLGRLLVLELVKNMARTISAWKMSARAIFGPPVSATSPSAKMRGEASWASESWIVGWTRIRLVSLEMELGAKSAKISEFGRWPVQGIYMDSHQGDPWGDICWKELVFGW